MNLDCYDRRTWNFILLNFWPKSFDEVDQWLGKNSHGGQYISKSMIYISGNEFVIHGIHFGLNENKLIIEIHFWPFEEKNVTVMVIYSRVWFEFPR